MDRKIKEILDRYVKVGPGEDILKEDLQDVHDFLIRTLTESGLMDLQAIKLIRMTERGSWNDGWFAGHESAKNHYTPRFSLNLKEN